MSAVTSFFLVMMAVITVVSVTGALVWAVIHIARGKFREQYEIATAEGQKPKKRYHSNRANKNE